MGAIVRDMPGHRKVTPIPIDELFAALRADSPEYRAAVDEGALAGTLVLGRRRRGSGSLGCRRWRARDWALRGGGEGEG